MGAALFEDGRWHVLMALNGERLSDYPHGCPTEEGARLCCYIGLDMFLSIKGTKLPPFEELIWSTVEDPQNWVSQFYRKPVWQP